MLELQEIQTIAQLVDNLDLAVDKLDNSYSEKEASLFNQTKQEMINFQKKISNLLG
jgi:hypothetical protein